MSRSPEWPNLHKVTEPLDLFFASETAVAPTLSCNSDDEALAEVCSWFQDQPHMPERFGGILRQSIDEVLDGQRTGRFDIYDDRRVGKTERTYLGTKVEIVCQNEFQLARGQRMDYLVAGHEVDAKFSMSSIFGQAIPREAVGNICLLMHVDDRKSSFNVAFSRPTPDLLNAGTNQDGKKTLSKLGRAKVRWLVQNGALPENQLLRLAEGTRRAIFDTPVPRRAGNGGQQRINQLFRLVQGTVIGPETIRTVANQKDPYKRPRDARLPKHLGSEGILILGHQADHPRIARDLGLPVPTKGEFVSAQVVPSASDDTLPFTVIDGVRYRRALQGDPITPAPETY